MNILYKLYLLKKLKELIRLSKNSKWSWGMAIICLLIFGIIRFTDINVIPLVVTMVVSSIIGVLFGFRSKKTLIILINIFILFFSILLLFALLIAYGRVLHG